MTPSLLRLFEGHETYLTFSDKVSGCRVEDGQRRKVAAQGGRLILGRRAGPEVCTTHLLHEMAHLVEIDDERCTVHAWGLKLPEVCVPGHDPFPEPTTFQATQRELRVTAIQRLLAEHVGVDFDVKDSIYSFRFMPDWWLFRSLPGVGEDIDFGDEEWAAALTNVVNKHYETLNIAEVLYEWNRKCGLVRAALKEAS